jgi:tRNA-dihydrouridine synthase B
LQEQKQIILEHYEDMLSLYGIDSGVKNARKHLGWYSSGLPKSSEFRASINLMNCHKGVLSTINGFYDGLF